MKVKISLYPFLYQTLRHFVEEIYNSVELVLDKKIELNLYKESFTIHRFFHSMTLSQAQAWKNRNKNKEYDFSIEIDIAMTIYEVLQRKELTPQELVLSSQIHKALINTNVSPLILSLAK